MSQHTYYKRPDSAHNVAPTEDELRGSLVGSETDTADSNHDRELTRSEWLRVLKRDEERETRNKDKECPEWELALIPRPARVTITAIDDSLRNDLHFSSVREGESPTPSVIRRISLVRREVPCNSDCSL